MSALVHLQIQDGVAHVVMDNPGARNALTIDMTYDMARHIRTAASDESVRCIVVRGSGAHFGAGADLKANSVTLLGKDDQTLKRYISEGFHGIVRALAEADKPTLAVIRGACVGFSFDLALACDLRLAARETKFAQVFARLGLIPDGGSSYHLPRLVGLGRALELYYLAESFDGETAADYGVVNRVVPEEELDSLASVWASRLAQGPPIAFRLARQNLYAGAGGGSLEEALEREASHQVTCLRSKDMMRGVQGFFMKKAPQFEGD